MINMLPGANVTSPDAGGLNGGNITLRGFNSDQLGMTIEGAPVNDSGNYALYPQEYVDSENIQQVSIAQGAADLDSPHIGATGGVINLYMRDPSKERQVYTSFTYGSHNLARMFARVDSGQIGNFRGMISYSRYTRDHWSGVGGDNRWHLDGKFVWDVGEANHVRASLIYNEAKNNFYANPSLAQFNTAGYKPNYNAALTGNASTDTSWYGYRINPFRNLIASLPSDFKITDNLTYDVVPYLWYGFGSGGGVSTMTEDAGANTTATGRVYYGNTRLNNIDWSGNGVVTAGGKVNYYNPSITETWRPGIINKLTYDIGEHKFVLGYWFESASHKQTAPYQALAGDRTIQDAFMSNSDGFVIPNGTYAGQVLQRRDWTTRTTTNVIFAGDTWSLLGDQLKLEYGIKQAFVDRTLNNRIPGATPSVTTSNTATLPTAGISYKLNEQNQVFASIATSFRVTPNYALADQYNTNTGARSTLGTGSLAPERAVTGEIGHRYQGDLFATSLSLFGTRYSNRQVTSNIVDPTSPGSTTSFNFNAGSVESYGLDFEIGTRPLWGGFRPYASMELLQTRLNNNLQTTNTAGKTDYLPTVGKQLPRAPNFTGAIGLDYDDGHILGNLAYKYIGRQYSTFMNDESIPGFGRIDAGIGYRFADVALGETGKIKAPELKLNFYNLLDARQLTGVNSVQANAKDTTGVNGGTIKASGTPNYYQGEGFAVMVTFKSAF
jgi:iron complex outermembrane receptor protein